MYFKVNLIVFTETQSDGLIYVFFFVRLSGPNHNKRQKF